MNTVISQALATGLPVITTRHSGLPEQVKDGENGLLVEEGNYRELAEKILYAINHSELWEDWGKFGRNHVLQNYDSKKLIDKQIDFYQNLLDSKQ